MAKKSLNDADSFDDCQLPLSKLEKVKGVRSFKWASEGVNYCDKRAKSLYRRHLPPLHPYYEQGRGSLSDFSHMDTIDLHPPTRGGGRRLQSDFARLSQLLTPLTFFKF